MHLNTREIAFTGLGMAMGVVLIILGGYLSTTTLFFLAASAFLAGIMERNFSLGVGVFYLVGVTILGLILSPQKLQLATFFVMGVYVLVAEWFEKRIYIERKPVKPVVLWGSKFLTYHVLLVAALVLSAMLFGMEQIFADGILGEIFGDSKVLSYIFLVILAEIFWLVFDRAYLFFQRAYGHIFAMGNR